jgi:hypothetical protein
LQNLNSAMSNTLGSIVSLLKISCVELLVVIVSLGNVDGSLLLFLGEEVLIDLCMDLIETFHYQMFILEVRITLNHVIEI